MLVSSRMYLNTYFKDQKHFLNYNRKVVSNKLGLTNFVGRKKFSGMVNRMWTKNDVNEIENFLYRIKLATPERIEASLSRIHGKSRSRKTSKGTGLYGIRSAISKNFVFGIQENSKRKAFRKLHEKIGNNSRKWRFEARPIKEHHAEMFWNGLKYREEDKPVLPDVNETHPHSEDKPVQPCDNDRCHTDLYEGDEVIEHAGYHYCCGDCLVNQMLKEGNALKITIGGY